MGGGLGVGGGEGYGGREEGGRVDGFGVSNARHVLPS